MAEEIQTPNDGSRAPSGRLHPLVGRCEVRRLKPCRYITQLSGETMQKCGRKAVIERDGKLMCRQCGDERTVRYGDGRRAYERITGQTPNVPDQATASINL